MLISCTISLVRPNTRWDSNPKSLDHALYRYSTATANLSGRAAEKCFFDPGAWV